MGDYLDPEEEFELLYGDEFDLMKEHDEELYQPPPKSRKSLDFSTPSTSQVNENPPSESSNDIQPLSSVNDLFFDTQTEGSIFPSQQSNSKKRTVDELFGDIDDIEDDIIFDDHPNVKKQKSDAHSEDLALIDHILELRKLSKEKHCITTKKDYSASSIERDKRNLSYSVPKYPFITITRQDKERIYVRFHSEDFEKEDTDRIVKEISFHGVMGDGFKEIWNEACNLINVQMDSSKTLEVDNELSIIQQIDENKQLWADLYKPRKYLELLSDESTNRIMLRWMKLWDKAVFNRKPKIKPMKPNDGNKKPFFKRQELNTKLDEHGRPEHKVALLCGPPGLGKTTLAHMVAKHAGYNVIEINASDDRNTEAFKTCLENATQMRSVIDQKKRPNCLIFDEIDGAPPSSIDYLVKFISGTASSKAKKDKSEKKFILKRPIICICNDVYVPSLRPLRQIAFVVSFPPTSSARLAERLMEIARKENVKTDLGAMLALAEKSNNDIRSCLTVLHFFKGQNKPVTLSEVHKASIGQKDMQKGLFSVWQEIFRIEKSKLQSNSANSTSLKETLKSRMKKVLQTVSSFGDYDRVAQGVFENYPLLKLKDSSFEGISECLEWFVFSDVLNKQIYEQQNYSLTSYLQYACVVWHFVFGTTHSQKLNYPSAGYEARVKETRHRALVSEVLRGMQPSVRPYCQWISLILDILPLLAKIIMPPLRPVNLHLYTKQERESMLNVVHVMIDYNLNYIQERTLDGTYSYNLEPNILDVVSFDNSERSKRRTLSYSNMQLIAREIELEKMRRFETSRVPETSKKTTTESDKAKEKRKGVTALPNHLQTLQAKTMKTVKPSVTKDFFGRIITKTAPSTGKSSSTPSNDIWYKYKEGYSNAVRKKILISSLK
ncbi:chromosome transmission fidelity protein 18 homolog [Anoplophora glabripennis]|nr:chromosome transmission fidelity protein 18 homolog [Anoplophora glabripennis]